MFGGVDRALFAASYARRLRRAGLSVALTSVERCTASLAVVGPMSVTDVYWVLRLSFVTRLDDVPIFDEVFRAVFDVAVDLETGWMPNAPTARRSEERHGDDDRLFGLQRSLDAAATSTPLPWATLPAAGDTVADDDADDALAMPELHPAPSAAEMDRPFDLMDKEELDRMGEWLEAAMTDWPQRRSRRRRPTRTGGQVAMRRTMRGALRTGGDVMLFCHARAQRRPRPIVVVLDVSGSMESYARIYLHLTRPLALVHRAEVFAFATELNRITPAIRARTCDAAIDHMNEVVGDRFSGTRMASSLTRLLRHRTWSTSVRGAVVLICSDGWDSDDPADLARAMKRLSLLSHRIVWVNPRAGADDFAPLTGGMAAALPYCDAFLAGHTGRSMREVVAALSPDARASPRRAP